MSTDDWTIFVGHDSQEPDGFAVTVSSLVFHAEAPLLVRGLMLPQLRKHGLYKRPIKVEQKLGGVRRLIDPLSAREDYDGAISTEFAISRFLMPWMCRSRFALFMDSDMLARRSICDLMHEIERGPDAAVHCVWHDHQPTAAIKMGGQAQTAYARKNWSSMFAMDLHHKANLGLKLEAVNELPGRDLHRFCWLADHEIAQVGPEWNYLVGHTKGVADPALVHFTSGLPSVPGYESCEYADEWRAALCAAPASAKS